MMVFDGGVWCIKCLKMGLCDDEVGVAFRRSRPMERSIIVISADSVGGSLILRQHKLKWNVRLGHDVDTKTSDPYIFRI
jgi:glucose uptake protein GlcU